MKAIFGRDTKALYTDEDKDYLVFRDTHDCFYFYKKTKSPSIGVIYKENSIDDATLIIGRQQKKKLSVVMPGPSQPEMR